ncbi:MAG: type IV pilus twitching motility protein PilT [Cellulosilyticaceae bacterium]
MTIEGLLHEAMEMGCSDLHLTVGLPPMGRLNGGIRRLGEYELLTRDTIQTLVYSMLTKERIEQLQCKGDVDFSFALEGIGRFRVNAFKQRGSCGAVIRLLVGGIRSLVELGMPQIIGELALKPRGLVLVTGPTGSGKSTTLAAMIDYINKTRRAHVMTIEDPIEYVYRHGSSIINQREVGEDVESFSRALRAALREDPDVILVGEMRDLETIQAAITAAETGHLVLSTLHTKGAVSTVDRMIDIFPASQQRQVRVQLANVLEGIVTQNLIPRIDGNGRVVGMEILTMNDAVRNLIREEKVHQIQSVMQTHIKQGMQPMDYHLAQLVRQQIISLTEAMNQAMDTESLKRYLNY